MRPVLQGIFDTKCLQLHAKHCARARGADIAEGAATRGSFLEILSQGMDWASGLARSAPALPDEDRATFLVFAAAEPQGDSVARDLNHCFVEAVAS